MDLETTGISRSRSAYSTHTRPTLLLLLANGRIEGSVYERDTKRSGRRVDFDRSSSRRRGGVEGGR